MINLGYCPLLRSLARWYDTEVLEYQNSCKVWFYRAPIKDYSINVISWVKDRIDELNENNKPLLELIEKLEKENKQQQIDINNLQAGLKPKDLVSGIATFNFVRVFEGFEPDQKSINILANAIHELIKRTEK